MTRLHGTRYLRLATLGDSTTVGIGDPVPGGQWRGWARHLTEALAASYDVSWCNLAISGATTSIVREQQLEDALAHRPDLASLVVGVNDTMRGSWDPAHVRDDLLTIASCLHGVGATLMTARFHDHGAVLGLPGVLRRPLWHRISVVNAAYDEVWRRYGGVRLDLAHRPELGRRECWSVDRFHPSELGHRALARAFATELHAAGYDFPMPSALPGGGYPPSWRRDVAWMVTEGAPWVGRRARDLGPWMIRNALPVGRLGAHEHS
ncbi:SGNH/GDSL hydrolase family protein [Nocardioides panacisoli]|uniref:SGNH/GDSL hydrolase family protein n=1 Tax=Nocardioides panacisoli TaxID=627624 RepID=UPI001C62E7A5|nr:SGNH/GDSL hydrolase family protein [Nocardioides panacisoli]QYJ04289.1 SGNH/GDSL hydrolase family protein [Nocardioides panacisoli]